MFIAKGISIQEKFTNPPWLQEMLLSLTAFLRFPQGRLPCLQNVFGKRADTFFIRDNIEHAKRFRQLQELLGGSGQKAASGVDSWLKTPIISAGPDAGFERKQRYSQKARVSEHSVAFMRIPLKLTTRSGGYWPPVPFYCDQLFRCKLST